MSSTVSTIPAAPVEAAGEWVSITEAVGRLGLSERTIRRQIADGRLRSRLTADRREVLVPPDTGKGLPSPDGMTDTAAGLSPVIVRQGIDTAELAALVAVADRRADELRADTRRARRLAGTGWTVAALLAVGTAWSLRELGAAQGRADAAVAAEGIHAAALTAERERADRLTDRLAELVETTARPAPPTITFELPPIP